VWRTFGSLTLTSGLPGRKIRSWRFAGLGGCQGINTLRTQSATALGVVGTTAIGHRDLQQPVKVLASGGRSIRAKLLRSPVAILFGSEKWGLSNDALSHCHWVLHIPTREEHQSMNLGQAVAVCLYELVRAKEVKSLALAQPNQQP